ncbi:hypothetical protein ACOME3_006300 [Neoechinorhynchus agilis]
MRLVLLPVTSLCEQAHVLLQYDFVAKVKDSSIREYALTAWTETVLPTGSVATVCSLITQHPVLRRISGCLSFEDTESAIEEKMLPEFKNRVRFYSLGETADVCICAFLVQHVASYDLNKPVENQRRSSFYYFWISLRDIRERLIPVDKIFKQPGISHNLQLICEWTEQTRPFMNASYELDNVVDETKQKYRMLVWDLMEQKQETAFPRPCHHHVPSFKQREMAAENLAALCVFKQARVVKVNPSSAHEHARFLILASQKVLLMPSPDWKSAPFYKVDPKFLSRKQIQRASTQAGAASLGSVLSVNALGNVHVDLMIVGSVAVNPMTGARIGEGAGYADLEYALMAQLGAVSERTVIATIVHESQLVTDLPGSLMTEHDLPVSIIATPKRVIFCHDTFQRPARIDMNLLSRETIEKIPALEQYRILAQAMNANSPNTSFSKNAVVDTSGISSTGSDFNSIKDETAI